MKNSRNNNIILGFSIWFQLIQWIDHIFKVTLELYQQIKTQLIENPF